MSRSSRQSTPSQWSKGILFLTAPAYHSSVLPSVKEFIQGSLPPSPSKVHVKTAMKVGIRIQDISDPSHPAYGQCGLFALKKIPPSTFIVDYMGEIHCDDRPDSDYDLSLHRFLDGVAVGIDASRMGNEARFINDYRGVMKKPNAMFHDYRTASGELRMCIRSCDEIKSGQEILVSYGKSWWQSRRNEDTSSEAY